MNNRKSDSKGFKEEKNVLEELLGTPEDDDLETELAASDRKTANKRKSVRSTIVHSHHVTNKRKVSSNNCDDSKSNENPKSKRIKSDSVRTNETVKKNGTKKPNSGSKDDLKTLISNSNSKSRRDDKYGKSDTRSETKRNKHDDDDERDESPQEDNQSLSSGTSTSCSCDSRCEWSGSSSSRSHHSPQDREIYSRRERQSNNNNNRATRRRSKSPRQQQSKEAKRESRRHYQSEYQASQNRHREAERRDYGSLLKYFFRDAVYFVMKSSNIDNVMISKTCGVWSTPPQNEHKLNRAVKDFRNVILIFSVKESGRFQGFARLTSESRYNLPPVQWILPPGLNNKSFRGVFELDWICRKELSFSRTHHLFNPLNEGKPVKIARDGQEIDPRVGEELCRLFPPDDSSNLVNHIRRMRKQEHVRPKNHQTYQRSIDYGRNHWNEHNSRGITTPRENEKSNGTWQRPLPPSISSYHNSFGGVNSNRKRYRVASPMNHRRSKREYRPSF